MKKTNSQTGAKTSINATLNNHILNESIANANKLKEKLEENRNE